jgi:hypothetical protein
MRFTEILQAINRINGSLYGHTGLVFNTGSCAQTSYF